MIYGQSQLKTAL